MGATPKKPATSLGFINEIESLLKGTDARQQAEKIQKQMSNALQSQVGLKEAATMDFETAVEAATDNVRKSLMNFGKEINSPEERAKAVQGYLNAKDQEVEAKEKLEHHLRTIQWLQEGQSTVNG